MNDLTDSHTRQGQEERARRLREHIERLKSGAPAPPASQPSLREQIEQRERELAERESEGSKE